MTILLSLASRGPTRLVPSALTISVGQLLCLGWGSQGRPQPEDLLEEREGDTWQWEQRSTAGRGQASLRRGPDWRPVSGAELASVSAGAQGLRPGRWQRRRREGPIYSEGKAGGLADGGAVV